MRLIPLLLLLLVQGVAAQEQATVYKSVDEHGVVTFSDTPPANAEDAQQLQINTPPPSSTGEYQENLEAMRETTDRMAADRREREKHRAEMRELQARTNTYRQPSNNEAIGYDNYITGYRNYTGGGHYKPGRPPWRPGHRPKPEHPIARPPQRPVNTRPTNNTRPTDGNAQLMRPMTERR